MAPITFTCSTRSNTLVLKGPLEVRVGVSAVTPAQAIAAWIVPNLATAALIAPSTSDSLVTSHWIQRTLSVPNSWEISARASSSRSTTQSEAP